MIGKLVRARATRAVVAAALVATMFAFTSVTPSGAAQSKTIIGTCTGADPASVALVSVLGGSALNVPFTLSSDVPTQLQPEQSGSPVGFTWTVALDQAVIDKAAGLGVKSLLVKNLKLEVKVSGPTSLTSVPSPALPDLTLNLAVGQPASVTQGPFKSTLTDVGKGGLIKYSAGKISFTIVATVAGTTNNVNVVCSAAGTAATTSIKIPGSPDIDQPIAVTGPANSPVLVDVLGKYVHPGTDEKGEKKPVLPETLKVLEGPGSVVNGQVQVNTGAAGSTSSVTFEVCSGTLPGTNEVQRLSIDTSADALKKGVAFTLKFGKDTTAPISMVGFPFTFNNADAARWIDRANNYILTVHRVPTPGDIQAALTSLPSIGAGGVAVTQAKDENGKALNGQYDIEFTGTNGEKDVPAVSSPNWYSVFPQEVLAQILALAGQLSAPPKGPTTTTTLPPGVTTTKGYFDYLVNQARTDLNALNFDAAGAKLGQALALIPKIILEGLDVKALIGAITGLFTKVPGVDTLEAGDGPVGICSQGVIDVSVTGVAGASTTNGATVAVTSATQGAALAFTG